MTVMAFFGWFVLEPVLIGVALCGIYACLRDEGWVK